MFACLYVPPNAPFFQSPQIELTAGIGARSVMGTLVRLARDFSPRIEIQSSNLIVLDRDGLREMFGDTRAVGNMLRKVAVDHGLNAHVAMSTTRTAAVMTALSYAGLTIIPPGMEASSLALLSLGILKTLALEQTNGVSEKSRLFKFPDSTSLSTINLWGLKTLGDLAVIPSVDLFERLGPDGFVLQRLARGEDERPLTPTYIKEPLEVSLALEHPIERVEALSFVLGGLFDALCTRFEYDQVDAITLCVRLQLVTRKIYFRTLQLPTPLRDPRVLRTLVLLDLESHPPSAGIDQVTIEIKSIPGRVRQFSLLEHALPSKEQISVLLARLTVLMGDGRCGTPVIADSFRPGVFEIRRFNPKVENLGSEPEVEHSPRKFFRHFATNSPDSGSYSLVPVLRRFRLPVMVRVRVYRGCPVHVATGYRNLSGGRVVMCAGPWRTSGYWWRRWPRGSNNQNSTTSGRRLTSAPSSFPWDRDEWEVALTDRAIYRIYRDRRQNCWFMDGVID